MENNQNENQNTPDFSNLYPPSSYLDGQNNQPINLAPASFNPQVPVEPYKPKKPLGLIIALIVSIVLFIASSSLALVYFLQMQDYKNNSDQKSAAAVEVAKEEQKVELEKQFEERYKEPLTKYTSPAQYGAVALSYPKTWSAYVNEGGGTAAVDAYFNPSFVPAPDSARDFKYALRAQILNSNYQRELDTYRSYIEKGETKVIPLSGLPNNSTGTRLEGKIGDKINGVVVVIPVRDKVLKIWTEGDIYRADFDNFIIKNLNYNP